MLIDRLQKIKSVINQYGEDKFAVSFSGGKDSTVLSALIDLALPGNKIPRVYVNTGIELNMMRDFVLELAKKDPRVNIIKPQSPIKPMLEKEGYPFKSKPHAHVVERYNRIGMCPSVESYIDGKWGRQKTCPKKLQYQFTDEFKEKLKVSDLCCVRMKEEPLNEWNKVHNRPIAIVGIMRDEGGRRENAQCLVFSGKAKKDINGIPDKFQPMSVVTKAWEEWFIKEYQVNICPIYLPPYNFPRTGCKGCPFALNLQNELDTLEKFFPAERKQCEYIWGPVYSEYRKLGYRIQEDHISNIWIKFENMTDYNNCSHILKQIVSDIPKGESNLYVYLAQEHLYTPLTIDRYYTVNLYQKLCAAFGDPNVKLMQRRTQHDQNNIQTYYATDRT